MSRGGAQQPDPATRTSRRTQPRIRRSAPRTGPRDYADRRQASRMFEIGSSLRAARMRQRLELSEDERDTRIRVKYLGALEDERFDVLPRPAYTKGFLRTYADYLGLDAQRFLDEYKTRFAAKEELAAAPPLRIRRRRFAFAPWLLVLVALAASSAVLAWRLSSNGSHRANPVSRP